MLKKTVTIALAFVGLLVGAGFASGQEVIQYFISFGSMGLWGVVVAGVLMCLAGAVILQMGSYFLADDHNAVFRNVAHPIVSRFLDISTTLTLFCIGFVMIAGAGSNLEQQFGLPTWVGAALMTVLVLVSGLLNVEKISQVIGGITPLIIIAVIVAGVYTLFNLPEDLTGLSGIAAQESSALSHWLLSAVNYTSMALMLGLSMLLVIGGNALSPKAAGIGGFAGGLVFTVLLLILAFVLFLNIGTVAGTDMPLLAVFDQMHPAVGVIVALVIYAMIYNTAIGMFYALGKRLTAKRPERFRPVFVIGTLAGFVVSFLGFSNLLGWVYPVLGYIGMVMIVVMVVAWVRGRARIGREIRIRDRLRELAFIKLHPRKKLSRRDEQEVRGLAGDSCVDGRELWESLQEEVMDELERSSDIRVEVDTGRDVRATTGRG
ncbi:YkvI family membrane protein [Corynebacterium halotolerans]|uniref:Membrane protein YkvI n=1 Tax=Corynebacterium halotolerans YIM 70093 = DSM 44683 TaxID=1121362 RepID=M1NXQ6_9CORY|nr:hypothetical protein [Corynebacterium halotolerans]AGF72285.1 hypothetical protein A605_06395 [Corynebacterium halotolerans YIM 70093 = DSM 44683]